MRTKKWTDDELRASADESELRARLHRNCAIDRDGYAARAALWRMMAEDLNQMLTEPLTGEDWAEFIVQAKMRAVEVMAEKK